MRAQLTLSAARKTCGQLSRESQRVECTRTKYRTVLYTLLFSLDREAKAVVKAKQTYSCTQCSWSCPRCSRRRSCRLRKYNSGSSWASRWGRRSRREQIATGTSRTWWGTYHSRRSASGSGGCCCRSCTGTCTPACIELSLSVSVQVRALRDTGETASVKKERT